MRIGRRVLLGTVVVAGCAPMATGSGPAPDAGGRGTTLRIGVAVTQPSVAVVATGQTVVTTSGGDRFSLGTGDGATVSASGGRLRVREWGSSPGERVLFTPRGRSGTVRVGNEVYRGAVEVLARGDRVTAVNVVGIEDYLPSVVGAEMGDRPASDQSAVAAQAVASRTYALKNRGKHARSGFDLRADVGDQVYPGVRSENDRAWEAVRATAGRVITYRGDLITAFFHSTCGPRTASPSEVFRTGVDAPFLAPVSDARPGGGYFNELSPYFNWQVRWTGDELRRTLRQTLPDVLGLDPGLVETITDLRVYRRGPSGRAVEVHIEVDGGTIPVFGADIRAVFRTPDGNALRTNAVEFNVTRAGGTVSGLEINGWGFGHGVGLCQWGAIGRSRAGHDYRSIIEAYYPGVAIERRD